MPGCGWFVLAMFACNTRKFWKRLICFWTSKQSLLRPFSRSTQHKNASEQLILHVEVPCQDTLPRYLSFCSRRSTMLTPYCSTQFTNGEMSLGLVGNQTTFGGNTPLFINWLVEIYVGSTLCFFCGGSPFKDLRRRQSSCVSSGTPWPWRPAFGRRWRLCRPSSVPLRRPLGSAELCAAGHVERNHEGTHGFTREPVVS